MITSARSDDSSILSAGPIPAAAPSFGNFSAFPPSGASVPSVSPHNNVGQWASLQHQRPTFPASASQQFPPSVGGAVNSQVWPMNLSCPILFS